jgi:hypothetical protein
MSIEAMKLALEALEWNWGGEPLPTKELEAMTALRQAIKEAALEGLSETSREIEQWDASDMAHRSGGLSVEQLAHDQVTYGMRITLGGKRVDPASIYKERVSMKPENIDTKSEHVDGVDIEPVAWTVSNPKDYSMDFSAYQTKHYTIPLYAAPPKREWQGLDANEIQATDHFCGGVFGFARAIEQRLKEKNNG